MRPSSWMPPQAVGLVAFASTEHAVVGLRWNNRSMTSQQPWLIVGLGNPGNEYAQTRHNVGYQVVDILANRTRTQWTTHRSRCLVAETRLGMLPGGVPGPRVILTKSTTYMNVIGGPVSRLAEFLSIPPERVLAVHDDLDLPAHELRLKFSGGEGGHNGLKSLTQHFHTKDHHRLRIGIGRPPGRQEVSDFVLAQIPSKERIDWDITYESAADVVEEIVTLGFTEAQQRLHTRG